MDFTLSDRHLALRDRARGLAAGFAERAAEHDASGRFPQANFEDLHADGLLALPVPPELGGLGMDYLGLAVVVEEIAKACASTALCFTMHCAGFHLVARAGTDEQRGRWAEEVLAEGAVWTIGFSEPGSGSHFLQPSTTAARENGGYRLNGQKFFVTSATGARRVVAHAVVDGAEAGESTMFVLSPGETPGVSVGGAWDAQGVRANDSRGLRLEDCAVPAADRLGDEGAVLAVFKSHPSWVTLGLAATSVGIAAAAFEAAREHAATRVIAPDDRPISRYQAVRFAIAEMATTVEAARLLLWHGAWWADHDPDEAGVPLDQAKYAANRDAIEVTAKALQVIGGRGYVRPHPVERYVRDARAGALMALTTEQARDILGARLLGVDPADLA